MCSLASVCYCLPAPQVLLHLITSPYFRSSTVTPALIADLAGYLTATASPTVSASTSTGLVEFKATLMNVLEAICQVSRHWQEHTGLHPTPGAWTAYPAPETPGRTPAGAHRPYTLNPGPGEPTLHPRPDTGSRSTQALHPKPWAWRAYPTPEA